MVHLKDEKIRDERDITTELSFVYYLRLLCLHYYSRRGEGGKLMESRRVNAFWNMSYGAHLNHSACSIQRSATVPERLT